MNTENEQTLKIIQKNLHYQRVKWSNEAKAFLTREKVQYFKIKDTKISLTSVLCSVLQNSCFGYFLKDFNFKQKQGKLINENKFDIDEWNYKNLNELDKLEWKNNNNFTHNPNSILLELVKNEDLIDINKVKDKIFILRLRDKEVILCYQLNNSYLSQIS